MFNEVELSSFLSVSLVLYCFFRTFQSYNATKKKIIDNGAQTVVTLGVLLTFFGITYSLVHFDTNPDTMAQEIDKFIAGMKTAFITSIIGMVFGLIIKYFQSGIEESGDKEALDNLRELKPLHGSIDQLNQNNKKQAQDLITEIKSLKASIDAGNEGIQILKESVVANGAELQSLRSSVEAGSSEELSKALTMMAEKMESFIFSVETSQTGMRQITENTQKQAAEFSRVLSSSIDTLSHKIEESGAAQTQQLTAMNATVSNMLTNSSQSAKAAESLLADTRTYQRESLANDGNMAQILTQNTATIDGMRTSFDKFLQDMAENYSNELINALNKSMEKLNTQLQTQFGDNFRQLNEAVKDVVTWQREYKEIVEATTEELRAINVVFYEFQKKVAGEVDAHIASLTDNLKEFTATTEKNVGIQHILADTTRDLAEMLAKSREGVTTMQQVVENFTELSTQNNERIQKAFVTQGETISRSMSELAEVQRKQAHEDMEQIVKLAENFAGEVKKLNETAFEVVTDINHYLRDFRTVSDDTTKSIREALEAFRADFDNTTKAELKGLQTVFQQLATNTDKQQDKAIKTLAGAMGAISEQIIGNYNALITRIAELDALLKNGGGKR